jgi:hypothetical protein
MTHDGLIGMLLVALVGLLVWEGLKRGMSCGSCLLNIVLGLLLIAAGLHLLGIGGLLNLG